MTSRWHEGEGRAFSFDRIRSFDDHILREIRGYDILDELVCGLADALMVDGTSTYDIGCSTGRLLRKLASSLEADNDPSRARKVSFVGIDPTLNLVASHPPVPNIELRQETVTPETRFENASLVLSVFALQFTPPQDRYPILRNVYEGLHVNGGFIWAEKVYASDPQIESMLTRRHIEFKRAHTSPQDILDKDARLQAIMRPLTLADNLDLLRMAGFTRHECFWRVNDFVALLAVK